MNPKAMRCFQMFRRQRVLSTKGYGLGVAVDDINDDGWPDIYVGNDFMDNDYLYINQQNGSFRRKPISTFVTRASIVWGWI